jgi:hypothetical protein
MSQILGYVVARADAALLACRLVLVKVPKTDPWNSFPPCLGMAFSLTPLTSLSAARDPTSTVNSWTAPLFSAQMRWPPPGVAFMLLYRIPS